MDSLGRSINAGLPTQQGTQCQLSERNYSKASPGKTLNFMHSHHTHTHTAKRMVQAWFMDSSDEDQRLPHQLEPPQPVSLEQLADIGVLYFNIPVDDQGEYKYVSLV